MSQRAWFVYNCPPSSEQSWACFQHVYFFPACETTGELICAICGIYDPDTYGSYPAPLSLDTKLSDYIIDALASDISKPSGIGQKRYVYVRS